MTGRELIIYILENGLEDKELFSQNLTPLFISVEKAAVRWNCGTATVKAMIEIGKVKGAKIADEYFVLASQPNPFEKNERTDLT